MKNQVAIRSTTVEMPRRRAKPRTGPTDRKYSRTAPIREATSALMMVPNDDPNERSTVLRKVRPLRTSSLRCS